LQADFSLGKALSIQRSKKTLFVQEYKKAEEKYKGSDDF
jgi:hypothetical protein